MKRLLFIVSILWLSVATAFAQNVTPESIDGAKFRFEGGDVYDFGEVKRGPGAFHKFEFENVGNQPIIIQNVTPSCGCTNVDWIKSPVLPGQKGWIQLSLKTEEQHGFFNKEVYIQSNAVTPHGEKRYTIYIKGNAVDDLQAKSQTPKGASVSPKNDSTSKVPSSKKAAPHKKVKHKTHSH